MKKILGFMIALTTLLAASASAVANSPIDGAVGHLDISDVYSKYRVTEDMGGSLSEFITKYNALRESGGSIEITDFCISACTLVLGLVPADRVCVRSNSIFGFHSAWSQRSPQHAPQFAKEATRMMWNIYPEDVRERLRSLGWDGDGDKEHPDLVYIKGTDLYKECK